MKSALSDIKMAIPACFLDPFARTIFPSFYLEVMYILDVQICFLDLVFTCILLDYVFVGGLRALMLKISMANDC